MGACHCVLVHLCGVFNTRNDTTVNLTLGDHHVSMLISQLQSIDLPNADIDKGEELATHKRRKQDVEFLFEAFSETYVLISCPLAWFYGQQEH